jgi:ferritin
MLSEKMKTALNSQIALEAYASNYYLAMASWCESQKLSNSARFLYTHSKAEMDHMMKIFHYMNQVNGHAEAPEVQKPPVEYKSLASVLELALENEKRVTKAIHELVDLALTIKDYGTFNFLQWYVQEQLEEERLFLDIHDKISMIGIKDSRGLYMADKYIGKVLATTAAS